MTDRGWLGWRLGLGLALALLGLLEVQGLVETLRSQARLRERTRRSMHEATLAAFPRLAEALRPGGPAAWNVAAGLALSSSLASEVEVYDHGGVRRFARPNASPVSHSLGPDERRHLERGGLLIVGPLTEESSSRLLAYAFFPAGEENVILRLSAPVPELLEDLRERHERLLGHSVALVLLAVAAGLVLSPWRERSPASAGMLDVYAEAMSRLRDRGEQLSRAHEAERRRMEDEIHEKEAMARAGELTAGIAHEVRNGLGTIVASARLIEVSGQAEVAREARRIREECELLEVVVRRFMDFVKHETLDLAELDLGRLLTRVASRDQRTRPGADVSLSLPPSVKLTGDEELLERAFENLIRNAREAAGAKGRVELGIAVVEGASALVQIADDGPGLPPGAPRIPRPFATTKAGGLGLGLPLAHKIIRLHGGELELADRAPHGLTVNVRLPLTGPKRLSTALPEVAGSVAGGAPGETAMDSKIADEKEVR